jgi:hypothetical protein
LTSNIFYCSKEFAPVIVMPLLALLFVLVCLIFSGCKVRQYHRSEQSAEQTQINHLQTDSLARSSTEKEKLNFHFSENQLEVFLNKFGQIIEKEKIDYGESGNILSVEKTKINTDIDTQKNSSAEQKSDLQIDYERLESLINVRTDSLFLEQRNTNSIFEERLSKPVKSCWFWWLIGGIAAGAAGSFFIQKINWKNLFS